MPDIRFRDELIKRLVIGRHILKVARLRAWADLPEGC
jgi:hypothetical protein